MLKGLFFYSEHQLLAKAAQGSFMTLTLTFNIGNASFVRIVAPRAYHHLSRGIPDMNEV
ncbi:hypothetical protein D3C78_457320 [compost metagenome]